MADITCEVIKDLLPLYVDDVLSPDSRAIVEEHLSYCSECKEYYQMLKAPGEDYGQKKKADEKAALRKIKKKINAKRLRTAIITAVCVAAVAIGSYYSIVVREKYIPYEESGLYVSDGALRADRNWYKSTGAYSPDGETLFFYMTTTVHTELIKDTGLTGGPVVGLQDADLTTQIEDDDGNVTEQVCKEIYYIPEEKARQLMKGMTWTDENVDKEIAEWKEASVLVWSKAEE